MAVEFNGSDPKQWAWAMEELKRQRFDRLATGEHKICRLCGHQGPAAWMPDGICTQTIPGGCAPGGHELLTGKPRG